MDAAASMIEKAIIANPTYAEAYNNLGFSFASCVVSKSIIVAGAPCTCHRFLTFTDTQSYSKSFGK